MDPVALQKTYRPSNRRVRSAVFVLAMICAPHNVLSQSGSEVHLQVTVTDETGIFVRDLSAVNFVVSLDKSKLAVREAKVKSDAGPSDISLLIDTSVIAGQVANPLTDITQSFIKALGASDQMAIIAYDSSANLIQDFTPSKKLLTDALRGMKYGNGAALLDAIYATADGGYANSTGRRVMVLLSTGIDTGSRVRLKDVAPVLQREKITLYGVSLGGRGFFAGGTSEIFEKLTVATGGRAFYPRKVSDIAGIVSQILGSATGREYYDLVVESPPVSLEEAQRRLRVQIDRDRKDDKNLLVTSKFVKE
ncbi:MAG: VWA domain-containing protein [Acidobacteriia bacterium]|nr:VWA domain-containing protein [Terriglobia bacterium]